MPEAAKITGLQADVKVNIGKAISSLKKLTDAIQDTRAEVSRGITSGKLTADAKSIAKKVGNAAEAMGAYKKALTDSKKQEKSYGQAQEKVSQASSKSLDVNKKRVEALMKARQQMAKAEADSKTKSKMDADKYATGGVFDWSKQNASAEYKSREDLIKDAIRGRRNAAAIS